MKTLKSLREQIDVLDAQIVSLLSKRMDTVKTVGKIKKLNNIPALDEKRWTKIIKTKKGYIKKIWELIHEEALKVEKDI